MPRIRSIKPEFCTSEQLAECSHSARLLFVECWMFCDDRGVHPLSHRRLKMECFPGDDVLESDVGGWFRELEAVGLVQVFEHAERLFFSVTGWHHQRIDKPSYKYPDPENSHSTPRAVDEWSTSDLRPFVDGSPAEGRGGERIGVERRGGERVVAEPSNGSDKSATRRQPAPLAVEGIVDDHATLRTEEWRKFVAAYKTHHPRARPGGSARKLYLARRKDYQPAELIEAVEGCHLSPFHSGQNDAGRKYQTLELILRSNKHVDEFREIYAAGGAVRQQSKNESFFQEVSGGHQNGIVDAVREQPGVSTVDGTADGGLQTDGHRRAAGGLLGGGG